MIEFGKTLRTAREAKGMTTRQVADATHMMVQMVEGIENEDFSRIVAPIYGRGFVKLYCEAVGLEPKPLVAAFMELYNGSRSPSAAPVQAEPVPPPRPAALPPQPDPREPKPETTSADSDAPIAPEIDAPTVGRDAPIAPQPNPIAPQPVHTPSLFDNDEPDVMPTPPPPPRPIFAPPPPKPANRNPEPANREPQPATRNPQPVNRYAAPMPIDDDGFSIPTFLNWRLVVLAVAAAAIVAIAVLGVRFIYRATMTDPSAPQSAATGPQPDPKPAERATPTTPSKPDPKPVGRAAPSAPQPGTRDPEPATRKPLPLKPFYIDSNHESQLKTDQKKKL